MSTARESWILFPKPVHVRWTGGRMGRSQDSGIEVTAVFPEEVVQRVKQLAVLGICLKVRLVPDLPSQGYRLTIGEHEVLLEASTSAGAHSGLSTLTQLQRQAGSRLPCGQISDAPVFSRRGFMLDISRCKVPTMATLRQYVDLLALLRYNELQLYMEHTFAFRKHRTVWRDASPMTAAEIRSLDDYCKVRGIELVPNLNSFGHFERWLKHPKYQSMAICPNGFVDPWGNPRACGSTLLPDKTSLRFIEKLYAEFLPNFSSKWINVGCDETFDLGQGRSEELCKRRGKQHVYLDYLQAIHRLAKKHGRRMIFWGDIILQDPDLIRKLPKDAIALNWGYESNHPFKKETHLFRKAGLDFYVCPGTSSWNSYLGRTENCLKNIDVAARAGRAAGALGYLVTDWGDGGHHQYFPMSMPGLFAGAAAAWSGRVPDQGALTRAIDQFAFSDRAGVLASVLLELGRAHTLVPVKTHNRSIFHEWMLWDLKSKPPRFDPSQITAAALRRTIACLDHQEGQLASARPGGAEGRLVLAEIRNGIAMARHACHRVQGVSQLTRSRATLQRELSKIITSHRRLWLMRNRLGGLDESVGHLEEAQKMLQ